ncbi:hypothetical protein GNI_147070 [Gregarina niphandrodes]|uniref:Uncharacterized protein n=1 Tax=Gregarina niphandrodes TaxID=110365 RepID=A0A023B0J7_GRENI|nr:hypothetical protein GNI_147070 [Gregarina niphandrodes]EZG44467.1 hypothetical protein GNI_147070 [Gregarina niphandrodes]|eukprot:XP_011134174.1 hypothetical protein GNI_147070 [Gregarina niphandrodes]
MLPNSTVLPSATRALADSWNQVEWCNGNSGRLVCGSTHANPEAFTANLDVSRGLSCYNFLAPFKYDLPSVWEAIVRHDAPERCAVVCDTAETTLQRRGRFLAKKFGIRIVGVDPKKVDDEVLEQFSYNRDCSHAHSVKDIKPEPECSCDFGVLECYVHTGTGREIAWGKLLDLDTNEEQLSKYVSGLHREGYEGTRCIFECYKK